LDSGWSHGLQELIALLPEKTTMAEVGCAAGESTTLFMESGKVCRLYAVDAWADGIDPTSKFPNMYPMREQEALFNQRMLKYPTILRKLKGMSVPTAARIPDASCDFVYIDACHTYVAVKADIQAYLPKVKAGGFIGGHDFGPAWTTSVCKAVRELLGEPTWTFKDTSWLMRRPV
jgi:hypothetical protein